MELIDTHCHLTFEQLESSVEAVLQRSIAAGVKSWITVGTDPVENRKVLALCEKYVNLYAALGIHPHEAAKTSNSDIEELKLSAKNPKVVAIGETGLDYHYDFSPKADQQKLFNSHLQIASELNMPVIIHSREAFDDTIKILNDYRNGLKGIVFHCFSYSPQQAEKLLDNDFFLSFTGVVTFKGARLVRESAKITPLERMMLETDCPYMTPEPMRKQKVNEPALLVHTAQFLSELKQIPLEQFSQAVTSTSRSFFDINIK